MSWCISGFIIHVHGASFFRLCFWLADLGFSATGEKEKSLSGVDSVIAKPATEDDLASKKSVALVDTISDDVMDSPNKIFVGGISRALSSKMLMEIAMAFGPLKAYQFVSSKDQREPFAFLEYADKSVTLKACAGLSGIKLGGKVITAVQAVPDSSYLESNESPFCGIPEHAIPLLEEPELVLRLKNVFDAEAILSLSETEIEEILEDVRLECVRFGTVRSVNVVNDPIHRSSSEACNVNDIVSARIHQNFGNDEVNNKTDYVEHALDDLVRRNAVDGKTDGIEDSFDLIEDGSHQPETLCDSNFPNSSILGDKSSGDSLDEDSSQPEVVDPNSTRSNSIFDEKSVLETMFDEPCQSEFAEQHGNDEGNDKSVVGHFEDGSGCLVDRDSNTFIEDSANKTTSSESKDEPNLNIQEVKDRIHVDAMAETGSVDVKCTNEDEISEETKQHSAADKPGTEADAAEKENNEEDGKNHGDIFERGCVFVEFKRKESSCMAAHCLQKRKFEDRIVTVRYVPLGVYRARFR